MELLKELCEAAGIPGREERIRAIARRELAPLVDEIRVDALGNLIAIQRNPGAPKLMIAAHMDEIGFIVTSINEEKGWLRVHGLGGHDPRNMIAQRVTVCAAGGDLPGILFPGLKPPHIASDEDRKKQPQLADFYIDLGMPGAAVKEQVAVGDMVVMRREFMEFGDAVSSKALDNRVAVYVMIEAIRKAQQSSFELYAVATTQEEIGLRGAGVSAFGIEPDVAIALDTTLAVDIPGVGEHEQVTKLGGGAAIKILDGSVICHPKVVAELRRLAGERQLPWQNEILPRGGTDTAAIQRNRAGVAAGTLSIPTRYIHSPTEMCHKQDVQACIDLLAAFIEESAQADLALE
jgi:tetrahedral aminopeptidase